MLRTGLNNVVPLILFAFRHKINLVFVISKIWLWQINFVLVMSIRFSHCISIQLKYSIKICLTLRLHLTFWLLYWLTCLAECIIKELLNSAYAGCRNYSQLGQPRWEWFWYPSVLWKSDCSFYYGPIEGSDQVLHYKNRSPIFHCTDRTSEVNKLFIIWLVNPSFRKRQLFQSFRWLTRKNTDR